MPLVRFEVRNEYGLGDPELYRGATKREDPKALLDGVAVAGLVGILRQLGDLAEFAADVFHDLHEQVMATTARGRKMLTQIQHIEAVLPSIEKVVQCQTSHVHFAYVAGSDWHANLQTEESHLLSSDLPQFIMDSYEECRDPPRLYMLDKFDIAGAGSCLRRYSDPSYFKRVWATSELARAEKGQRENKAQRYKRKGSRLRNGEVQQSISIAQQRSSSTRFASPATDGQSMSSESTFISDMRLKSEVASTSVSFDPKIRLNNFDRVSDTKHSVVHDELESDNSSISNLLINHSNICAPIPQDGPIEDGVNNYTQHDILEGPSFNGSPSVTWDEKIEIVRPTSPKSCEDILVDIVQSSESPEVRCEPLDMNHEIANLGAEEEEILFDIENVPVPVSGGNHFDAVTSETDNYMDALNTMESETETDSECQTKREVESLQNCTNQELDLGREKIHEVTEITASNVDSADVETPISSNVSLNRDASLKVSNLDHSEDLVFVHTPHSNGFSPIPDYTHAIDVSESSRDDIPRMDSIEDRNGSLTLELSKLGVKTPANTSELQDLPAKISSTPGAMIWTNGGLLGLEPSKPPDFSAPDTAIETISSGGSPAISDTRTLGNESILRESCSAEKMNGSNSIYNFAGESSLRSDEPTEGIYDLLQHDALECSLIGHDNQYDSMTVKQNFQEPLQALQLNEPERCQTATSNGIYADIDLPDLTEPKATASGVELANNESRSSESVQTSLSISSSLSGLAQRFLANSLQRKASLTNADITLKSEMVNIGMRKSQQTSLPNKHQQMSIGAASQAPHEPRNRERAERGSCRSSISSSSHCSGQSSPPLEHMKISFHPLNGSETSKLKLDFSNANVHESIEDLMFPSFQLLPASTVPLAEIGFGSDDDTFCQSCPYSSEELLSPRSDSNSEFWEQDERGTNINNGIYDDSQRISSSSASVSSFIGFEEMNHHRIDPASGLKNAEIGNSIMCLQSGPVADLPSLDSVKYSKNEQEREGDSSPINPIDTALQSVNDLPPSRPPPLPPIQWRMMKSSFLLGEEMNSIIAEKVDHFGGLQDQGFTVNQKQEHGVPTQPPVTRAISLPSKTAHGKEKLNGEEEMKHRVQDKEPLEREEFLQQIRNKTFNLRRTVTAKPSFTPQSSTNVNVAAILEKANAIRQAFVGSDEGGDDDNWSDG